MASMLEKVAEHCSHRLKPGEAFEGAVFGSPAGSFGRNVAFGVGGLAGAVVSDRVARRRRDEHGGATEAGTAAGFPAGDVVLAVTGDRLLVFGFGRLGGRPKELLAEYPLAHVAELVLEQRKMHRSLQVRFADGSVADLDVVGTARPGEFLEAFVRVKG